MLNVDDAAITNAATDADKLGIDCPLGWPDDFLVFLQEHHAGHVVAPQEVADRDWRRKLAYRATDRVVRERAKADSSECGGRPDRFDRHASCRDSVAPSGRRPPRLTVRAMELSSRSTPRHLFGVGASPFVPTRAGGSAREELIGALLERTPWLDLRAYADLCAALRRCPGRCDRRPHKPSGSLSKTSTPDEARLLQQAS